MDAKNTLDFSTEGRIQHGGSCPYHNQKISECPICSEVCVNHLHYGGISCYSCKAFFRRSVTAPRKKMIRCKRGDGKCNLRLHLRNNCPHCRLMKCFSTGMKEELVLSKYTSKESKIEKSNNFIKTFTFPSLDSITEAICDETLILTLKARMNLMCVPSKLVNELDRRIRSYSEDMNPDIFLVQQIKLAFLTAKHSVSCFLDQMIKQYKQREEKPTQANIFSTMQEYFVRFMILFLQNCTCFQSIPISSQIILLRKNIGELSILLATISFDREYQVFRWGLGNNSTDQFENILEFSEENMNDFLENDVIRNLLQVSNSVSEMEIPGILLVLLIMIIVFSRDGINMDGQCAIDTARGYYLHLLFRYLKLVNQDSSKTNASLHIILKTFKDFAEEIRSQLVGMM